MSHDLTETQNFTVGTIAAFIEAVLLQPTLYFKNAKAQNLPLSLNPRVVYRGTAVSIFNEMQMMGLQFVANGFFQRLFVGSSVAGAAAVMSSSQEQASAVLSGAFCAMAVGPIELVMIQQQVHGGSVVGTLRRIASNYGVFTSRGLYRGLLPTMLRDSIYVYGMLGATPIIQKHLLAQQKLEISPAAAGLYASLLGGLIAAIPSQPFDIVKTCMQGDVEQQRFTTVTDAVRKLYSENGLRRFFNGGFWRAVNITATVYVANECRLRLPPLLYSHSDGDVSS